MTPSVQFSSDTGSVGGTVGGLFGKTGGALGAIGGLVGGVKFKEAETTLLVADVRSGIQIASAEGQASKMNFSLGGWGWGGFGWASAGAAKFIGNINPQSGGLMGVWQWAGASTSQGIFSGQRQ